MRRAAVIFLAAILLPCLVLAWLAVRSAQDQQVIMEHQQAIIDQGVADSLAQNVRAQMDTVIADFVQTTRQMQTAANSPESLASGFHQKICGAWPLAQVGFAVDLHGTIYAPSRNDGRAAQLFREENGSFLSNRSDAEVYLNTQTANSGVSRNLQTDADLNAAVTSENAPVLNANNGSPEAPAATPAPSPPAMMSGSLQAPPPPHLEKAKSAHRTLPSDQDAATAGSADTATASSSTTLQVPADALTARPAEFKNEDQVAATTASTSPAPPPTAGPIPAPITEPVAAEASIVPKGIEQKVTRANKEESSVDVSPAAAAPAADSTYAAPMAELPTGSATVPVAPAAPAGVAFPVSSPAQNQQLQRIARQVAPQENTRAPDAALSNLIPAQSDFRQLIGQSTSGSVARFLDDKLCLLVWSLPAHDSIVFGAQVNQEKLIERLRSLVTPESNRNDLDNSFGARADYCLVLIDDKGKPVAQSQPGFSTDWKHPFVATEIGGVLPHWEAALYLTNPGQVSHSAHLLHYTIWLIIAVLIVAIIAGGTLIGADVARQMRLAQQKTDFVSNVSHELKTPLTSIRMFADMLAEGRVEEPEKRATYLHIISAESARLTRLINNVLDFARMERGAPAGERHACDLVEITRDVVETCRPHLDGSSVSLTLEVEADSLELMGDRDALSQIVLNLISNAEKYGGDEITVRVRRQDAPNDAYGCVDVLDRGPGIPLRQVESVFAPFHRLDDSLASGVPGSGLGLTLARRMARAHGGNVTYQSRAGGGSCFTLAVPLGNSAKNRSA